MFISCSPEGQHFQLTLYYGGCQNSGVFLVPESWGFSWDSTSVLTKYFLAFFTKVYCWQFWCLSTASIHLVFCQHRKVFGFGRENWMQYVVNRTETLVISSGCWRPDVSQRKYSYFPVDFWNVAHDIVCRWRQCTEVLVAEKSESVHSCVFLINLLSNLKCINVFSDCL